MTKDLLIAVTRFLADAQFEVLESSQGPFALIAQNESALVFVVEVTTDLSSSVRSTLSVLSSPFRSKSFGPKTMEMYAVLLCPEGTLADEIARCERDIRICRKLPVISVQDVYERLFFLKPIGDVDAGAADPDALFWREISHTVKPQELELLKTLKEGPVGPDRVMSMKAKD